MTLSPRRWLIIGVATTLVLMLILYAGVISPARSRENSERAQLQTVQGAITADRSQLVKLLALAAAQPAQLQEAFRLSKAIPVGPQTPGVILELQRLATESNVQFSQIRTMSTQGVNNLIATDYEINVVGPFFDVDDFMYRVQRQVEVSSRGALSISGRLFAVTGEQISLASETNSGTASSDPNTVAATLQLLAFSQGAPSTTSGSTSSGASGGTGTAGSSSSSGTTTAPSSAGGLG